MFASGALWRVCDVVCRSKCPLAVFAEKAEVLGMAVFVGAYDIEHHPAKHLLHLYRILSEETGQSKEIYIIYALSAVI